MNLSREARLALATVAIATAVVGLTLTAYQVGLADARLDRPIVCGDTVHENGVHRARRSRP